MYEIKYDPCLIAGFPTLLAAIVILDRLPEPVFLCDGFKHLCFVPKQIEVNGKNLLCLDLFLSGSFNTTTVVAQRLDARCPWWRPGTVYH